jgi:hypothetical protein
MSLIKTLLEAATHESRILTMVVYFICIMMPLITVV